MPCHALLRTAFHAIVHNSGLPIFLITYTVEVEYIYVHITICLPDLQVYSFSSLNLLNIGV